MWERFKELRNVKPKWKQLFMLLLEISNLKDTGELKVQFSQGHVAEVRFNKKYC